MFWLRAWHILMENRDGFAQGLITTFRLAGLVWLIGVVGGFALGWASFHSQILQRLCQSISFLLTSIPILVFLMWMHYPLQNMLGIVVDPFYTATTALAVINVAAISDLTRRTLADFPKEYLIAAWVTGLAPREIIFKIQLPILLRQMLPALIISQVNMLHATMFASLISVEEIFRISQRINASIYQPVEIYTGLGLVFLLICLPLNGLALFLKVRFTRNIAEQS